MNKHNQTAVFYQEKWDMQFGHSSPIFKNILIRASTNTLLEILMKVFLKRIPQ
jgi:hypothetical protein